MKEGIVMSNHIEAKIGEVADVVLLPGDPLRAKYIAEKFLEILSATIIFAICLAILELIKAIKFLSKELVWVFLLFLSMHMN